MALAPEEMQARIQACPICCYLYQSYAEDLGDKQANKDDQQRDLRGGGNNLPAGQVNNMATAATFSKLIQMDFVPRPPDPKFGVDAGKPGAPPKLCRLHSLFKKRLDILRYVMDGQAKNIRYDKLYEQVAAMDKQTDGEIEVYLEAVQAIVKVRQVETLATVRERLVGEAMRLVDFWEAQGVDLDHRIEASIVELQDRQAKDLRAEFRVLDKSFQNRRPHFSNNLLELFDQEPKMCKARAFNEALRVIEAGKTLEKAQTEAFGASLEREKSLRLSWTVCKQTRQMNGFVEKMQRDRRQQEAQRNVDRTKLRCRVKTAVARLDRAMREELRRSRQTFYQHTIRMKQFVEQQSKPATQKRKSGLYESPLRVPFYTGPEPAMGDSGLSASHMEERAAVEAVRDLNSRGFEEFCRAVLGEEQLVRRKSRKALGLPLEPLSSLGIGGGPEQHLSEDRNLDEEDPGSRAGGDIGGGGGASEAASGSKPGSPQQPGGGEGRSPDDPGGAQPGPRGSGGSQPQGAAGSPQRQAGGGRPQSAPSTRQGGGAPLGGAGGQGGGMARRMRPSSSYGGPAGSALRRSRGGGGGAARECDWCGRKYKASRGCVLPEETDANSQVMKALNSFDFPASMVLGNTESTARGTSTREGLQASKKALSGGFRSTSKSTLDSFGASSSTFGGPGRGFPASTSAPPKAEDLMEIAVQGTPSGVLETQARMKNPAAAQGRVVCMCCSWQCCRLWNEKYSPHWARARRELTLDLLIRGEARGNA